MYIISIQTKGLRIHFEKGIYIMKKTAIRIVSITLVIVMACFALASCSNAPKGTYGNEDYTLEFSGEKVTLTYGGATKTVVEGTFEMDEDEEGNITIDIELPEASWTDGAYIMYYGALNGSHKYNAGSDTNGDYIEVGTAKLYKK